MTIQPYIDKHAELVERCKKGESKAQYEVYKHYSKAMFNVSLRILNHVGEAKDVLQDAFIDAFNKVIDFRGQSTFGVWLKQIVVNKAINQLRNRKVQLVDIDSMNFGEEIDIAEENSYDEESVHFEVNE